ncbi:MAG: phosphatase PAP2 family protein [Bacteroidales bacterium]|nr:phosphatase PAP2 family protein [Bacteroidales bacterium]MBN2762956.1 phosphatase PAP2 family protein [Bacteroidales bacterium]
MKDLIKQKSWFFVPFVFLVVLAARILFIIPKDQLHLIMNSFHTGFFDHFFTIVTWMGDGLFVLLLCVALLFFSFRLSAYLITTYALTGLFVQLMKRFFFEDMLRPAGYFRETAQLYLVEGVKIYYHHSFPSGHAATAFGLFLGLALAVKNKALQLMFLVMASVIAYSRVYLSQHFFVDVFVGSFIGITGALALFPYFYRKDKKWHKLSLLSLIKK